MVKLDQLFHLKGGIASSNLEIYNQKVSEDHILYLRPSQKQLNVISGYVDKTKVLEKYIFGKDTIYISTNGEGSHSYAYVSTREFVPNSDVVVLLPKVAMTLSEKLYYSMAITANRYKFSYGIKPKGVRLKNVRLPDLKEIPSFVTTIPIPIKPSTKALSPGKKIGLKVKDWEFFRIKDIFEKIEATKGSTTDELVEGNEIPYIGAKKDMNGFDKMCSKKENEGFISDGNCIVFIQLGAGSAGYSLYQKNDFIGMSGKTSCGYNKKLNEYNGMFLVSILDLERPKFSFGRSWTGDRLLLTKIKLPAKKNKQGEYEPDWQFMEDYIKSLPYSAELATSA